MLQCIILIKFVCLISQYCEDDVLNSPTPGQTQERVLVFTGDEM